MATKRTSLSVGAIIRDILMKDEAVRQRTNKIFPVATDTANLPYILYRRADLQHNPTKAGQPGADTVIIEVVCYTATYAEGIELAETVRTALDYSKGGKDGLAMRSCTLSGSEEGWEDDAFVQQLDFTIKI